MGELGPYLSVNRGHPNLGPRLSFLDLRGQVVARLGRPDQADGLEYDQFLSPHGIAVDSHGDIYVGK